MGRGRLTDRGDDVVAFGRCVVSWYIDGVWVRRLPLLSRAACSIRLFHDVITRGLASFEKDEAGGSAALRLLADYVRSHQPRIGEGARAPELTLVGPGR
jgi:hypothetical protein